MCLLETGARGRTFPETYCRKRLEKSIFDIVFSLLYTPRALKNQQTFMNSAKNLQIVKEIHPIQAFSGALRILIEGHNTERPFFLAC